MKNYSVLTIIFQLIFQSNAQTTIIVSNLTVTFTNNGRETLFIITSMSEKPSNAWMSVGLNNEARMV